MKLYCATYSPNCHKVLMTITELGVADRVEIEHYNPRSPQDWFISDLHPGNKVPLLTDGDVRLAESGAINLYLAERFGRLLPERAVERARCLHMLFFEASAILPDVGGEGFFGEMMKPADARDTVHLARVSGRIQNHLRELDGYLADGRSCLAGPLSIADFQLFAPMTKLVHAGAFTIPERVQAWEARVGALPSVRSVYAALEAA